METSKARGGKPHDVGRYELLYVRGIYVLDARQRLDLKGQEHLTSEPSPTVHFRLATLNLEVMPDNVFFDYVTAAEVQNAIEHERKGTSMKRVLH